MGVFEEEHTCWVRHAPGSAPLRDHVLFPDRGTANLDTVPQPWKAFVQVVLA